MPRGIWQAGLLGADQRCHPQPMEQRSRTASGIVVTQAPYRRFPNLPYRRFPNLLYRRFPNRRGVEMASVLGWRTICGFGNPRSSSLGSLRYGDGITCRASYRRFPNLLYRRFPNRRGAEMSSALAWRAIRGLVNPRSSRLGSLRYGDGSSGCAGTSASDKPFFGCCSNGLER